MAWPPQKKSDPVAERSRALNAEIAALEKQIKKLGSQTGAPPSPRLRSTIFPGSAPAHHAPAAEPVFEEVDQKRLKSQAEAVAPQEHFNELGVRKYDLAGLLSRCKKHFAGASAANPRLVSYLAAGGVQGLRPLRHERRVSRNRFIAFAAGLVLLLLGLLAVVIHNH